MKVADQGASPGPVDPPAARLFPFVRKAGLLIQGRDRLRQRRKQLEFIWVTEDLSDNSRKEIERDFRGIPRVITGCSADLERWFGVLGTRVLGFRRSPLTRNILQEMEAWKPGAGGEEKNE